MGVEEHQVHKFTATRTTYDLSGVKRASSESMNTVFKGGEIKAHGVVSLRHESNGSLHMSLDFNDIPAEKAIVNGREFVVKEMQQQKIVLDPGICNEIEFTGSDGYRQVITIPAITVKGAPERTNTEPKEATMSQGVATKLLETNLERFKKINQNWDMNLYGPFIKTARDLINSATQEPNEVIKAKDLLVGSKILEIMEEVISNPEIAKRLSRLRELGHNEMVMSGYPESFASALSKEEVKLTSAALMPKLQSECNELLSNHISWIERQRNAVTHTMETDATPSEIIVIKAKDLIASANQESQNSEKIDYLLVSRALLATLKEAESTKLFTIRLYRLFDNGL